MTKNFTVFRCQLPKGTSSLLRQILWNKMPKIAGILMQKSLCKQKTIMFQVWYASYLEFKVNSIIENYNKHSWNWGWNYFEVVFKKKYTPSPCLTLLLVLGKNRILTKFYVNQVKFIQNQVKSVSWRNFCFIECVKWGMWIFWKFVLVKFVSNESLLTKELVYKSIWYPKYH